MRAKLIAATLAGLSATASLSVPVHAQDKVDEDIVVTAPKQLDAKTATHFVREISATTQGQLARIHAPICPMTIGLAPAVAAAVVARMRDIAARIGAEVDKPNCRGNVVLVATPDGRALVRELRRSRPAQLSGLTPGEIDRLIARPGPVRTWARTAITNEDGTRASGGPGSSTGEYSMLEVKSASNFTPASQQVIDTATIVIDSDALVGKSVIQLADYAAMRLFARTRPLEGGAVDTILGLFGTGPGGAPDAMSQADLRYLEALYAMPGNRRTSYQVGRISRQLRKDDRAQP